jgi:hypothetical protein
MIKKSLEERVQRLKDIHEIQNLMSRYQFLHVSGVTHQETADLFAQKTPGVKIEMAGGGVFEGTKGVQRQFTKVFPYMEGDRIGFMATHTLTTPVIEVAGDGKTAQGLWIAPGSTVRRDKKTGKLRAFWILAKVGTDFVKEDNVWKIWHLHIFMIYQTLFEESWLNSNKFPHTDLPAALKADRPTTYHKPYSPLSKTELIPALPKPYETWIDEMSYVK